MPLTSVVMNEVVVSPPPPCSKNDCCSDQSSSSSSSIGKNSDISEEKLDEEEQVESKCKSGGPLDAMDALEEVLPIRRGISRFYNGKSKTFASLIDASLSSVKEIVKPNNAYARRRRNLLAHTLRGNDNGTSKKAMAATMSSSETDFDNWRSYSSSDLHLQQQFVPSVTGASCLANPT